MRKIATIFLFMVTFGMLFAGAVSAADPPSVDVTVINQNGDDVNIAHPGDEVAADVIVSNNNWTVPILPQPEVDIVVDPETGLQFEANKAVMWDGSQYITNNPNDPFFYRYGTTDTWIWDIYKVWGDMQPHDVTELIAPAIVTGTGNITVGADLWGTFSNGESDWYDGTNDTFLSVQRQIDPETGLASANAATVPMQDTGAPLALAALGLLGIIGGTVYSKLK